MSFNFLHFSARMDELDGMYDDMQERLYEVDKSRKNNLVFYGIPQNGPDEDPDVTERLIKSVVTNKLQVLLPIFPQTLYTYGISLTSLTVT